VPKDKMHARFLDTMDLEQEKGITIKMQPVRMTYKDYILNLIDTPGHVDFNYEVSRSLEAVEGGILLVDASKGIQAQTIANLELAKKAKLVIIPAVNKIDLAHAQIEQAKIDMANLLSIDKDKIFAISAKIGTGTDILLKEVIDRVPVPKGNIDKPLKALVFDSDYDPYKGVITYLRIFDGKIKTNDTVYLIQAGLKAQVKEVGYFSPALKAGEELNAGEIGYIATGIKDTAKVKVGETITLHDTKDVQPLPGYKEPKPMVFASVYPEDPDKFDLLKEALGKLKLNDYALTFELETKEFLGRGFQCGFLGSLHAEIIWERLKREFDLDLIISTPSVVYKIINKKGNETAIFSASDWPDPAQIEKIKEPWVKLEVITPSNYLGNVLEIMQNLKAITIDTKYLSSERLYLTYELPLRKIITGLFDQLKGATQGFASMNYELTDERASDLVKVDILIAGVKEDVFSRITDKDEAYKEGKKTVEKLKEIVPKQLFAVALQAAISGKIIARETIKAKRRDVTAPLYGGDVTRKRKLLERQKKGKKKMEAKGAVNLPPRVFLEMFKG
jgi:GTP-binding protein LepA